MEEIDENEMDDTIKSEEVQAIIDRMPTQWAKYVTLITGILIGLIIVSGFIIRYHDTVDGQISITASIAPVRLVANTSGRLHILEQNKNMLREGNVIAYIESGADYRDILLLDSLMNQYIPGLDCDFTFPFALTLGEIASAYNTFIITNIEYERIKNSNIYETVRKMLTRQIETDKDIVDNMEKELALKKQIYSGSAEQLEKDKALLEIVAITEEEYEEKQQRHLSKEEAFLSLKSNILARQSEIVKNNLEIQRINYEEKETAEKALSELMSSTNNIVNIIRLWKEKYLQIAPLDGELEYLSFWRENSFVANGQELFSIIPNENDIVGEVMIASVGAGKVEIGQKANVKINKFPYDEFGLLKGRVESISRVYNKIETREGTVEAYQVIISFPDGFVTNFGIPLFLDFESKGSVEIITKPKRLIERLFDNLKALGN